MKQYLLQEKYHVDEHVNNQSSQHFCQMIDCLSSRRGMVEEEVEEETCLGNPE